MKKCCICKKELPESAFAASGKKKNDGLQYHCRVCHKEYRRQHYLKNRQKYIDKAAKWNKEFYSWWNEYKSQYFCQHCGESHIACVQFHHPNDDKELGVSQWVSRKDKDRLIKEVSKCIPLCANCHFKLHWNERNAGMV